MKIKLLSVFFLILTAPSSFACLHYAEDYRGALKEGLQEYFIFHDGKNAHMILRTQLSSDKFPKEVAWVLPFPALPLKYEEINGPFFDEVRGLFQSRHLRSIQKGRPAVSESGGEESKIRVHNQVNIGSFQIQPIEILKDDSSSELNSWLRKNKFNSMPLEKQKKYLKKGAVFLAIRMQLNHQTEGELLSKSLHVVYSANQLSVPMLFTHDSRVFDIDLYVFSKKALNQDLSKFFLEKTETADYKNLKLLPFLDDVLKQQEGKITLYRGLQINGKNKKLDSLSEDPTFPLTPEL